MMDLMPFLARMPLIAILRGVTPEEVVPIGHALVAAGFVVIEVPLNSPRPLDSIRRLVEALGPGILVGAGTVRTVEAAAAVSDAGGRLVVMPHADTAVIRASKAAGLLCAPGVATPTEGFSALDAGADALKLFPAEMLGPPVLRAFRSVFPPTARLIPVGGITPDSIAPYITAGAAGFGLGSALYKPGWSAAEVAGAARGFVDGWRTHARPGSS